MSDKTIKNDLILRPTERLSRSPVPGYRPNVAMVVVNDEDLILMGRRTAKTADSAWQVPQGGVDRDESPRAACIRELAEETGLAAREVRIVAWTQQWQTYAFPPEMRSSGKGRTFAGQCQAWFLLRLVGDSKPSLAFATANEFDLFSWRDPIQAVTDIIAFKRQIYHSAFNEFASGAMATSGRWRALAEVR